VEFRTDTAKASTIRDGDPTLLGGHPRLRILGTRYRSSWFRRMSVLDFCCLRFELVGAGGQARRSGWRQEAGPAQPFDQVMVSAHSPHAFVRQAMPRVR
jgi:hypothetical protein